MKLHRFIDGEFYLVPIAGRIFETQVDSFGTWRVCGTVYRHAFERTMSMNA